MPERAAVVVTLSAERRDGPSTYGGRARPCRPARASRASTCAPRSARRGARRAARRSAAPASRARAGPRRARQSAPARASHHDRQSSAGRDHGAERVPLVIASAAVARRGGGALASNSLVERARVHGTRARTAPLVGDGQWSPPGSRATASGRTTADAVLAGAPSAGKGRGPARQLELVETSAYALVRSRAPRSQRRGCSCACGRALRRALSALCYFPPY